MFIFLTLSVVVILSLPQSFVKVFCNFVYIERFIAHFFV